MCFLQYLISKEPVRGFQNLQNHRQPWLQYEKATHTFAASEWLPPKNRRTMSNPTTAHKQSQT